MFRKSLALSSFVLGISAPFAGAESAAEQSTPEPSHDDIIEVLGHRSVESRNDDRGHSVTFRPEDSSQMNSATLLRQESSVVVPETSRISPSGFVVPRIRGEDATRTDVYIEDIRIQDPYSQLPLVEDLDLRAVGSLALTSGLSPFEVPGVNSAGTLQYRFRAIEKRNAELGSAVGRPFGHEEWGSYRDKWAAGDAPASDASLYVRQHATDGKYPYYSDNGTPYNTRDDMVRIRDNNDQTSRSAVPAFHLRNSSGRWFGFGLLSQTERSVPSTSENLASSARTRSAHSLGALEYTPAAPIATAAGETTLRVVVARLTDAAQTHDPAQDLLITARQSDFRVSTSRLNLTLLHRAGPLELNVTGEDTKAYVASSLDDADTLGGERRADSLAAAARLNLAPLSLEVKAEHIAANDQIDGARDSHQVNGAGATIAYAASENIGAYAQWAESTHLPSLSEEWGDGGGAESNHALEPERIRHSEVGASVHNQVRDDNIGIAYFEDRTLDKIIFVPVATLTTKALNLDATRVRGWDVHAEKGWGPWTLHAAYSGIEALDVSHEVSTHLPDVPDRVALASGAWSDVHTTLRWLARYEGAEYLDTANTVRTGSTWIHDASADYRWRWDSTSVALSLAVRNVFDVLSVPVDAPDTPANSGTAARSDSGGNPLPGRQWLLTLVANASP